VLKPLLEAGGPEVESLSVIVGETDKQMSAAVHKSKTRVTYPSLDWYHCH